MTLRILLSGCSSGGKSTLLAALAARGHHVVAEPGRRVIAKGGPRPEADLAGFLEACLTLAIADLAAADGTSGPVYFDRGLTDALSGLDMLDPTGAPRRADLWSIHRYAPVVLMAPPWPDIFAQDRDRTHGLSDAVAEYDRQMRDYPRHGYRTEILARASVSDRVVQAEALALRLGGGTC